MEKMKNCKNNEGLIGKEQQEFETLKADYIKYCFELAQLDLIRGDTLDGREFLSSL